MGVLLMVCAIGSVAGEGLRLEVHGIELVTPDVARDAAFFEEILGFESAGRDGEKRFELEKEGLRLVLVHGEANATASGSAVYLNFYVDDFDARVREFRQKGVRFLGESPEPIAIGRAIAFADPAGHPFNLIEVTAFEVPAAPTPRIFNIGMRFPDLESAERFYGESLGFAASTRHYLPQTLPLTTPGATSVVLHRREAATRPGEATTSRLVLRTDDLSTARSRLAHVTFTEAAGSLLLTDPGTHCLRIIETPSVARLDWIAGNWVCDRGSDWLEETWTAPAGDSMVGSLRWLKDGKTWMYELMSITREETGVVFRLRHFSRDFVPWEEKDGTFYYPLARLSADEAVFENPERDQPRRFVYQRTESGLVVRVQGAGTGESSEMVFEFRRRGKDAPAPVSARD